MIRLYISTFILIFCVIGLAQAQEKQESMDQFDPYWGIGIICRSDNQYESEKTSFPNAKIAIYSAPNGLKMGTVGKDVSQPGDQYAFFDNKGGDAIAFARKDMIEVTYEGTALKYYREVNGYVNILINTISGGGWLLKTDLDKNKFKTQNWMNFLLSHRRAFYYKRNSVDLKTAPDTQSELLGRIDGDLSHVKFTGKINGLWAEVAVEQYDKHPLMEDGKIINKRTGWIKAIDEKGRPQIWFYTRGM